MQTQSEEYEQQNESRRKLEGSSSPFAIFVWLQEVVLAPGQQAEVVCWGDRIPGLLSRFSKLFRVSGGLRFVERRADLV